MRGPPTLGNPFAHHITLNHSRLLLLGLVQTNWVAEVSLNDSTTPPVVSPVGDCQQIISGVDGRGLDAGNLTLTGGPNWPLVLAFDPGSRTYAAVEDLDDPTDGALFATGSVLQLSAFGGADILAIAAAGPWFGVAPLEMKSPQDLPSLPAVDLHLSWTAAPRSDTSIEVFLLAPDRQIVCALSGDPGIYTVKKAVLGTLPHGPVYILVSRVSRIGATTTPDHGPVLLESRSSWQIVTTK